MIVTWYRPPNSAAVIMDKFEKFVDNLDAVDMEYYIVGDMNCDMIDPTSYESNTKQLIQINEMYQLKQFINEPTRVTEDTESLIDLFNTNQTKLQTLELCQ